MDNKLLNLEYWFDTLKKRCLMITIITLIITIISVVVNFWVIKPQYEASTKVFIGKNEIDNKSYSQDEVIMYQKLMKTYSETIKTKDLISRGIKNISPRLDVSEILDNFTVETLEDTQILQIKYISISPKEAKDVIQGVATEFIKTSNELVPNGYIKIIEKVELPEKPISPNKSINIIITFFIGLIIGVGLAFLLEYLDNTFKEKKQLEREFGISVIGLIPILKEL